MVDCQERTRLVLLGGPMVGKSAIIKRFLFNSFPEKHKPTVEDLYSHEFEIGSPSGVPLKVDILDTAGDMQFPAMRRLSIANASAFLLVYAIDSSLSFEQVKSCFEEIREQRADFQEVPIIIAGNKADIGLNRREVEFDEVCDWIHDHLPKLRGKAMECSAKENRNVREIFKGFLTLSKIPFRNTEEGGGLLKTAGPGIGLRRRSSAYAGSKSRNVAAFTGEQDCGSSGCGSSGAVAALSPQNSLPNTPSAISTNRSRFGMLNARVAGENNSGEQDDASTGSGGAFGRNQQRSRSLIRRVSRKAKQITREGSTGGNGAAGGEPGDCRVS